MSENAPSLWRRTERLRIVSAVLLGFCVIWEAVVSIFDVPSYLFPSLSTVAADVIGNPGWYAEHAGYTLAATLIGFALAVVFGTAIAIGIVYSRILEYTLYTGLVASNAVPKVAIAPLFVIWIGTELESKVAIALLIAIFPIVIDTVLGLKSVDPAALDLAKALRGSQLQILRKIRFPNALPSIFAGMKVGISLALIGTIVGEFVGSNKGLGFVIIQAQGQFEIARQFAAIALLAVLGTILFYLVELAERYCVPWHVSQRGSGNGH
tara:strand:- start:145 stop:942 length:798 start_codon:yes stop_codon:yes gene_type:complete